MNALSRYACAVCVLTGLAFPAWGGQVPAQQPPAQAQPPKPILPLALADRSRVSAALGVLDGI